ncbi:MAG: DUF3667 domain-containing protein [Allosphingosinicella sp.]
MAIEGLGEAVTGGLIARAVEPEAGEAGHEAHSGQCLNCGTNLVGDYCHVCGQKGHVHRSLRGFGHDLVHSVFHFEGKLFRTLPVLAWRPGELTRRYIEGERARFVSPVALFLFSVFLMFAVFGAVGGPFEWYSETTIEETRRDMQREIAVRDQRIAGLERQRRALAARSLPTRALDAELAELRRDQSVVGTAQRIQTAAAGEAGAAKGDEFDLEELEMDTGWQSLDDAVRHAAENPALLGYKLQSSAYKFSWALIPISVPFVWLLFLWRRGYKLYDHMVFVTYSLAFMTLLLVVLSLIRAVIGTDGVSKLAFTFIPPLHMYRQLRGAYGLRRFSAIWRTVFLIFFALVAGTLFFLGLLTLGLLG